MPKKQTRAQLIKHILTVQAEHPPTVDQHHFAETTGYIRCQKCGISAHKRINEQAFQLFIGSPCVDQAYFGAPC